MGLTGLHPGLGLRGCLHPASLQSHRHEATGAISQTGKWRLATRESQGWVPTQAIWWQQWDLLTAELPEMR